MIVHASIGASDIAAERLRQIVSEGYDALHDDDHDDGELAIEAAILALAHTDFYVADDDEYPAVELWGLKGKHPDTRRRLVIAGALIAAEIDRLDREAARKNGGQS